MTRLLLKGIAIGAALVAVPTIASTLLTDRNSGLYIRIAEDSPLIGTGHDLSEEGPPSARLIHECGIASVVTDSVQNDHTASSFFKLADASTEKLNCVVGKARAAHLGLAFSEGIDTAEFYKVPGDPVAYTRCDPAALVAGSCQPKKK